MPFGYNFGYGFGFTSGSVSAWLALNGDLTTDANGDRFLVNSKGANIASTTNTSLTFDGVVDGLFTAIDPQPEYQMSVRISWDNYAMAQNGTMLGSGATQTSMQGFLGLFLDSGGKIGASYRHRDTGGTLQYYTIYSVDDYTASGTAHATFDVTSGEIKLYLNGVLNYSEVFPVITENPVLVPYGTYKFAVGVSNVTGSGGYEFAGNLGNAQFFNGLMTASQVLDDFNNPEKHLDRGINGLSRLYNQYIEDIVSPTYDSGNTEHLLITNALGNWTSVNLNNPNIKHFFVEPSAIAYGLIELTQSGTADNPRTIQLYNSNHIHPSRLADAEQASIDLLFSANYWHVNRMSAIDNTSTEMFKFDYGATNNIVHRCNFRDYFYGIKWRDGANYNTVQLCYLDTMTHAGRVADSVGLALTTNGLENVQIIGSKMIANDIRNAGDGIQLVRSSAVATGSYDGTIIDSNRIWLDSDIYTNGDYSTNGYNPLGEYQVAEEATDFKIGSDDANNPVLMTNNIIYGYRKCDETVGGLLSTGAGAGCVVHFGVKNLIIEHNIIYDCPTAIGFSGTNTGTVEHGFAGKDCIVRYNIFANLGLINPTDEAGWAKTSCRKCDNVTWEENVYYNCQRNTANAGWFMYFEDPVGRCAFNRNIVIDSHGSSDWWAHDNPTLNDGVSLVDFIDNYYYASTSNLPFRDEDVVDGGNHNYTTVAEANMLATSFDTQTIAENHSYSLIGTASTATSPHIVAGHTLTDLSQATENLILAIPMIRGELAPRMFKDGVWIDLTPEVDMTSNWVNSGSIGLQGIYFDADMTKADTMHISTTKPNQIIAPVPTGDYTVKVIESDDTEHLLNSFTTNIDTAQILTKLVVSEVELKSIQIYDEIL